MGRSVEPTTHVTAASYGPMPSARGLVWRRHCWLAALGAAVIKKKTQKKIEVLI